MIRPLKHVVVKGSSVNTHAFSRFGHRIVLMLYKQKCVHVYYR